ncbi:4-fold beta flower protein [Pseudomonas sp. DWRC2-2]|uniref:4-fold beta flower protein n=1 Tax=Pseudomonas sp. DWRC2-2 TaxID=2804567 RepID=UPI003CED412B
MSLDFYDRDRMPIAYTDDDEHLYSYCGRPVAYIHEGSIYSYPGHHLGCISDGVIRDNHGHIVLYTADSRGGCEKPYLLPTRRRFSSRCDTSSVDDALSMKSRFGSPGGRRCLVRNSSLD